MAKNQNHKLIEMKVNTQIFYNISLCKSKTKSKPEAWPWRSIVLLQGTFAWETPSPRFEAWSSPTRELRDFQSLTFRRCGRCRRWGPTSFAVETKRFPSKRPSQQCPKIILARFYKPSLKPLLEPVNRVTRLGDFWKFLTEFLAKGAKIFMTIWALFKSTIF